MLARVMINCLLGLCLSPAARAGPASRPYPAPRIALSEAALSDLRGPTLEALAAYEVLHQAQGQAAPLESQGAAYDRDALLADPEAFAGKLVTLPARCWDVDQVRFSKPAEEDPALAWSILATDETGNPVQILILGPRPRVQRQAWVQAIGYFYRIRLEAARSATRASSSPASRPVAQVPVFIGWILPQAVPPERPRMSAPWQLLGATLAGAVLLFYFAWTVSRRRVDWRTRLRQRGRPHRDRVDPPEGDDL